MRFCRGWRFTVLVSQITRLQKFIWSFILTLVIRCWILEKFRNFGKVTFCQFEKVKSPREGLFLEDVLVDLKWLSIVPLIRKNRSENPSWNLSECLSDNLSVWKWNRYNLVHVVLLQVEVTDGQFFKKYKNKNSYGMSLLKTKLSDMVNVQNIIDIYSWYKRQSIDGASVWYIAACGAIEPVCYLLPCVYGDDRNLFTKAQWLYIKQVSYKISSLHLCSLKSVRFWVLIISAISQLTVEG